MTYRSNYSNNYFWHLILRQQNNKKLKYIQWSEHSDRNNELIFSFVEISSPTSLAAESSTSMGMNSNPLISLHSPYSDVISSSDWLGWVIRCSMDTLSEDASWRRAEVLMFRAVHPVCLSAGIPLHPKERGSKKKYSFELPFLLTKSIFETRVVVQSRFFSPFSVVTCYWILKLTFYSSNQKKVNATMCVFYFFQWQ